MISRGWVWAAVPPILLAGCSAQELAAPMASIAYVRDHRPLATPASGLSVGDRLRQLTSAVTHLDPEAGSALARVDANTVAVTLYYDACAKSAPALRLDGERLTVRYAHSSGRTCIRAIDTLVVFVVPRGQLPQRVTYRPCADELVLDGSQVSEPSTALC